MMSSGPFQWSSKRKMSLHAFEKAENLQAFHTENRIENPCWFVFHCHFCLGRWSKSNVFFLGHSFTSAYTQDYELKFSTQTNSDTLISNPKFYFSIRYRYDLMCRIIQKISKITSFVSSNPQICWFSVIKNFIFDGYYKCSILFPNESKKGNIWNIAEKLDLICQKSQHHIDDVIKKGKNYYVKSIFFNLNIFSRANMPSWWRHYWFDPDFLSQNIHLMPK